MTAFRHLLCALLTAVAMYPVTTVAAVMNGSFRIAELFSNADGTLQFVQLVNVDRSKLAGTTLTTSGRDGTRTFTFPATSSLPQAPFTEFVLIVSESFTKTELPSSTVAFEWDYVMPDGFLPRPGGAIELQGIERWEYSRLPNDGYSALYQAGGVGTPQANSSAHGVVVLLGFGELSFVSEYVTTARDRHFITAFRPEKSALNAGQISGWHQIYEDFVADFGDYTGIVGFSRRAEVFDHSVCRFYLPPPDDSHFFTASESECAEVQVRFPRLILETDAAFHAGLPDPITGACAIGTDPVYRLWNPATNDHWFTADDNARLRALSGGYVSEGFGPKGASMCVLLSCYVC